MIKPTNSVVIHVLSPNHIKVDLGIRLSQDSWDELFKIPKSCAGISLQHPDKTLKQTWFGFECKFNSCWNYKTITMLLFDTLKTIKEVESIRVNNLVDKNDAIHDCRSFVVKNDSISD